jgi:hypothetical protein
MDTFSQQDAVKSFGNSVRELSLQLHIHKANASHELAAAGGSRGFSGQEESWRPKPLQKMKTVLLTHLHLILCLLRAGKNDIPMAL